MLCKIYEKNKFQNFSQIRFSNFEIHLQRAHITWNVRVGAHLRVPFSQIGRHRRTAKVERVILKSHELNKLN
jgi:hypothetical protein